MGSLFVPFLIYKTNWIKNKITLKNFFNYIFSIDRPIIPLSMVFILIFNLINSLVGKTEEANNSLLNVLSPVIILNRKASRFSYEDIRFF